jgi:hypothetical protein
MLFTRARWAGPWAGQTWHGSCYAARDPRGHEGWPGSTRAGSPALLHDAAQGVSLHSPAGLSFTACARALHWFDFGACDARVVY